MKPAAPVTKILTGSYFLRVASTVHSTTSFQVATSLNDFAYAMVSTGAGVCSTTFSPHLENVVVPPPPLPRDDLFDGQRLGTRRDRQNTLGGRAELEAGLLQLSR